MFLWDDAWMRERAGHKPLRLYELWNRDTGNWGTTNAHQIFVVASPEVPTILLRRHVMGQLRCPGLGGELTLLEEAAGFTDAGLVVQVVGHNIDVTRPPPSRCVRVVIWNEVRLSPGSQPH